jgi:hypothetical protein
MGKQADFCYRLSNRLIYASLYGLDVSPQDPLARNMFEAVASVGRLVTPGSYPWVEHFPWLYYMPPWFPGCGFKQDIEQTLKAIKEMDTLPFNMAMDNLVKSQIFFFFFFVIPPISPFNM